MSLALYRKYRPQTFAELVGQNHIKTTIQSELSSAKVAHAYLFSGPRGLGKTTVARLIAKSVNCLERKDNQSEPCNRCVACREITAGRSLDVIEIDAASHTGVDNVRENIIAHSRFTPTNRKFKVFIIDEVHMLSISAFNALLKTLEEPPDHALFILATTEIHKIPETIISRCQRFDFRKVNVADLLDRLKYIVTQEKKKVDNETLENIARFAQGGVRDAETLLGQVLSLDEKNISREQAELVIPRSDFQSIIQLLDALAAADAAAALLLINQLVQQGIDLQKFTADLIEVLRKLLLAAVSSDLAEFAIVLDASVEKEFRRLAQVLPPTQLVLMIDRFILASRELKSAAIDQLPLELAIVEICRQPQPGDDNHDDKSGSTPASTPPVLTKKKKSTHNSSPRPTARQTVATPLGLTLEAIGQGWDEVLTALKEYNQSLASTLRHHRPTAVSAEGVVQISFKYKFYQQRIDEAKNRQLVEKILHQVFKAPLRIETVINKNLRSPASSPQQKNQSLDDIVKTFGGQLVD